ncbi:MAG: DUF11 domain-containing protein [Actinomycetota bacterium]|nr:DUF11 domain-containing protein [Actinomycetota bacterium]
MVRDAKLRRIVRAAAALGAVLLGLALTTSVAEAVVAVPDVTVSIAGGGTRPLVQGTSFNLTLVARNDGAATAHDVIVSTSLPAGVVLVSPPPACLVGSPVRCPVGDLEPDGQVRIELAVRIQDGTCGQLRSFATISASDEPAIAGNDDIAVASASVGCLATTTPDLVVDATSDAAGPIQKGHAVRYALTVTNAGTASAHHVTVTDRLPSGVEPINLLPKMDGGSCSAVGSTEGRAAFTIVCLRSTLYAGASATVTIDIRVNTDRPCGPMRNRVTVSAKDEPATAQANDSASHVDTVECEPSIVVSGDGPRAARVGDHVRSLFAITNDGEVPLHDLAFRGAGCDVLSRSHPGPLQPGHRWSVTCARTIRGHGLDRVAIVAHVTARTPGDALIRDVTVALIRVIHPELSVSVEASATSGRPGDTVTYTFVVTNTGDSLVRGISVVHDRLGVVGRIGALAPGAAARVTSSEAFSGRPATLVDTTTATGSDLSGFRVSARTTTSLTVLAARNGSRYGGGTAFTGSDVARAGAAGIALLAVGGVALWVGFRQRHPLVGH